MIVVRIDNRTFVSLDAAASERKRSSSPGVSP